MKMLIDEVVTAFMRGKQVFFFWLAAASAAGWIFESERNLRENRKIREYKNLENWRRLNAR